MKTGTMVAIGIGVVAAAVLLRGSGSQSVSIQTPAGTMTVPSGGFSTSQISSAIAQQREAMIQRIMARDHLSRADAEARYNQLMPAVSSALSMRGLGSYYASA